MATKPTINTYTSPSEWKASALNNNFNTIADAFDDLVAVDGANTTITEELDMNTNRVKNVGAPTASADAVRLVDLQDAADLDSGLLTLRTELANTSSATEGAKMIGIYDDGGLFTATDVEAALAEVATDIVSLEDRKVKVSSNDTTAGYLNGKILADGGMTFTETDAVDESITIAKKFRGACFYRTSGTSAATNTVDSDDQVTFNANLYDTDTSISGATFTIPASLDGQYVRFSGAINVNSSGTTMSSCKAKIFKDGAAAVPEITAKESAGSVGVMADTNVQVVSPPFLVATGDIYTLRVDAVASANDCTVVAAGTWFAMEVID